ncbi:MFS transporter [Nocardioides jiangxiensis]|uniref:MFS transporter n=1 Tax=Nocardioides jiangxiensis TaxID=3064524 RepID=A0ABT9AZS3_9ACTN|nr:MFS transporter [Nocardioides sp. WY-20]MDO7866852.1 MFS transporter [Nocardioides sp. WY-20]
MTTARSVQRTYLLLMLGNTLAASLIWGINTIFLLDSGLSNLEAFAANAAFTAGMVLFEIPTGIVADTVGRRASYLLGTVTLAASTLFYVGLWQVHGPFWLWLAASVLIGLGFTFFSGAVEAWLVDALAATGFDGSLDSVFGRGQMVSGAGMLVGSVAGGWVAQHASLGVPYLVRAGVLLLMLVFAAVAMRDLGFAPERHGTVGQEVARLARQTVDLGWQVPAIRWLMVQALVTGGVGLYAFYALQPYLLQLYGDPHAYQVAGLVAAAVALAQMAGGLAAGQVRRLARRRTSALMLTTAIAVAAMLAIGSVDSFGAVLALSGLWGLTFAAFTPVRQSYLNGLIPSRQRATLLSADSLMSSAGGVWAQPALGRVADLRGYAASYLVAAGISAVAIPLIALSRRTDAPADSYEPTGASGSDGSSG